MYEKRFTVRVCCQRADYSLFIRLMLIPRCIASHPDKPLLYAVPIRFNAIRFTLCTFQFNKNALAQHVARPTITGNQLVDDVAQQHVDVIDTSL